MREPPQHILILTLLLCGLFMAFLGAHPYITPSEARYIEVPRQMVLTSDWIVPHINGVPYFEKPPLFYWMQAATFSLFGWGEFAGRLMTALLSVALCLLTYALGRELYSPRTGIAAALLLASSWLGFGLSRMAMLDVPLTVCITGVLLCFLKALQKPDAGTVYGMYLFTAAGVMTKGLIGALLPGMVLFLWLFSTGRWSVLKQMRLLTGTLLFLALVVPWHVAAAHRYPQFWQFYIIHEHFSRFLTDDHHRNQPWWFFLTVVVVGWMPWTPFLFPVLKKAWADRRQQHTLFLLLWAVLPLLFFSLSHSKLVPYIYPVFPPLAVLLAPHMEGLWENKWRKVLLALAVATPVLGYAGQAVAPYVWRGSVKQVASALLPKLKPGDEVAIYGTYRQDLPIYLNRNVTVVAYEGELAFGTAIEPKTKEWMIGTGEFWKRCRDHRLYVLMPKVAYETLKPEPGCALKPAAVAANPPERFVLLTNE